MFTYGEYYENKEGLSLHGLINKMVSDAMSKFHTHHTKGQCNRLEKYLNQLFYPEKYASKISAQTKAESAALRQTIQSAYEQKYNAAISNFESMGSSGVTKTPKDVISLARRAHEDFDNKKRIHEGTLRNRFNNVQNLLNQLSSLEEVEQVDATLKAHVMELYDLLNELIKLQGDAKGWIQFDSADDNIVAQIIRANELYRDLSASTGAFSPQDYGQILEWALEAASADAEKDGEALLAKVVKDAFILNDPKALEKVLNPSGAEKVSGTDLKISLDMSVERKGNAANNDFISLVTKPEVDSKGNQTNTTYYEIDDGQGGKFQFKFISGFNMSQEGKYQKMDVDFMFNDPGASKNKQVPFRISAKNWSKDNDFGETSLIAAMIRNFGSDDYALQYAFIMQDKGAEKNAIEEAHQVAKLSAFLDILMGYSQEEGYADTIVINRRSAKEVKVYSIRNMLLNIQKQLKSGGNGDVPVSGYDGDLIKYQMEILSNAVANSGQRSERFKSLAFKYLQSIQLTVHHNQMFKTLAKF